MYYLYFMPTILLIRHGQASFGLGNYDQLSSLGERQATVLGRHLSSRGIVPSKVYSGNMQRHHQTASLSLKEMGVQKERIILPEWDEFDHEQVLEAYNPKYKSMVALGVDMMLTGDPKAGFQKIFSAAVERWVSGQYDSDYKEPWGRFKERVKDGLSKVVSEAQRGEIVLVYTSGGAISVAASQLLGFSDAMSLQVQWRMANCSISTVQSGRSGVFLASLNEFGYLETHKGLVTFR